MPLSSSHETRKELISTSINQCRLLFLMKSGLMVFTEAIILKRDHCWRKWLQTLPYTKDKLIKGLFLKLPVGNSVKVPIFCRLLQNASYLTIYTMAKVWWLTPEKTSRRKTTCSHENNTTKRRFLPKCFTKKTFYVPDEDAMDHFESMLKGTENYSSKTESLQFWKKLRRTEWS